MKLGQHPYTVATRNVMIVNPQHPPHAQLFQMSPSYQPFKPIYPNQYHPQSIATTKRSSQHLPIRRTLFVNPAPDIDNISILFPKKRCESVQLIKEVRDQGQRVLVQEVQKREPVKQNIQTVRSLSLTIKKGVEGRYEEEGGGGEKNRGEVLDEEFRRGIEKKLTETRHKFLVIRCKVCSLSIPSARFVDHFFAHKVNTVKQPSPSEQKKPQPVPSNLKNSSAALHQILEDSQMQSIHQKISIQPHIPLTLHALTLNIPQSNRSQPLTPVKLLEYQSVPVTLEQKLEEKIPEAPLTARKDLRVRGRISQVLLATQSKELGRQKSAKKLSLTKNFLKPSVLHHKSDLFSSTDKQHPRTDNSIIPTTLTKVYNYDRQTPIRALESPMDRSPSPSKPKIPRNILAQVQTCPP